MRNCSCPRLTFYLVPFQGRGSDSGAPAWCGRLPCDYDFFAGRSGHFPVWIIESRLPRRRLATSARRTDKAKPELPARIANLSTEARSYLKRLGYAASPDEDAHLARLLWRYALAVLFTPSYRRQYHEALRHSWPRIPLPGWNDTTPPATARKQPKAVAALGDRIAETLLGGDHADQEEWDGIGVFTVDGHPVAPEQADGKNRTLDADWGVPAKNSAVRPRPGTVTEREYTDAEARTLSQAAARLGLSDVQWRNALGDRAVDIHANPHARWAGIPERVRNYVLGGHQVLVKWLSYREGAILKRPLAPAEIHQFTHTAQTLARLRLLEADMDKAWSDRLGVVR